MKNKLKLITIFAIVILFSFIPETFPEFFGDWVCQGGKLIVQGNSYDIVGCSYTQQDHMPSTHWGFRHWMWTLCGVTLFIWNVVELIDKKYRL